MIDAPERTVRDAQQVAAIHLQIPLTAMRAEFPQAVADLFSALQQQGISAAGSVFAHHFRRPTESFDFNVCVPVMQPIQASGRVEAVAMPSLPVVKTTYRGDYAGLPHAWGEFIEKIHSHVPAMRGDFIEAYTVGPKESASSEEWRTDLSVILITDEGQTA